MEVSTREAVDEEANAMVAAAMVKVEAEAEMVVARAMVVDRPHRLSAAHGCHLQTMYASPVAPPAQTIPEGRTASDSFAPCCSLRCSS